MAEILLIDDDTSIHQIVSLFLEDAGHQVHSAITGQAGLMLAEQTYPDLIVLDIAMPGMDGIAILHTLRANQSTANIPVMIYTAHDQEDFISATSKHERVSYLEKPVDMHTLQANVNAALRPVLRRHDTAPAYAEMRS